MTQDASGAWRCTVCGFIHRGPEPPELCPVCGADRSDFEPFQDASPAPAVAAAQWQCLNCGYVHDGPEAPDICPVCAASQDRFEAISQEAAPAASAAAPRRVLVLGAGIAGVSAVEAIRATAPEAEITLLAREEPLPYYRLNLTRLLAGEIDADELPIHPAQWYRDHRVELVAGHEASGLAPDERTVSCRDGMELTYDALVVTVGAHPFLPPLPGAQREGVRALRQLSDAEYLIGAAQKGGKCVIVGGGLLGIEAAGAMARRGMDVTLLEGHEWLMPRQLCRQAGRRLAEHLAEIGIALRTSARSEEIVGDERVAGVALTDGSTVPADVVIIATGVRPNSYLARRAGMEVNQGIVVDNHLQTSAADIFAAGDVAEHHGMLYGSWAASQHQGRIAGLNAAGAVAEFGGIPRSNTLKVLGLDMLSIGRFEPTDGSDQLIESDADGHYVRLVFHDGRMVGAILLGDTEFSGNIKHAIEGGKDFSALLKVRANVADVLESLV